MLIKKRMPEIKVDELRDLTVVEIMLARDWSKKWKEQGLAEGKVEGKVEGEVALLSKRFGELPLWACEKLNEASVEQLELWSEKFFDTETLESFFA